MTAFTSNCAQMTGFHSLKGDRWGVVLQVAGLPPKVALALKRLHHAEPVMIAVVPHDANDLFCQNAGECEHDKMTESRRNKLSVQRLWEASAGDGARSRIWLQVPDTDKLEPMTRQARKLEDVLEVIRHPDGHPVFEQLGAAVSA